MIKVCSLDFLNKQYFETDVKIADGRTVAKAGEKITPETILKLYFRDIFVEKPLSEESKSQVVSQSKTEEISNRLGKTQSENDSEKDLTKLPKNSMPDFEDKLGNTGSTPIPASISMDLNDEKLEASIPVPKSRFLEDDIETEASKSKGPTLSEIDFESKSSKKEFQAQSQMILEPENTAPIDKDLEFDKEQAERISQIATKLGKAVNASDMEDLKNAALYCNIGIQKFKESDLNKKDFETFKAVESARIAENDYNVSSRVTETIRLHANDYDSDSFSLNQKIPHYHILGIAYYYEKMSKSGNSKQAILDKMLQLGGNKFNIFVLHKFIRIMKETNE